MLANQEHQKIAAQLASGDLPHDEPVFTLRGRDPFASTAIRFWIDLVDTSNSRADKQFIDKLSDAEELAKLMDAWPTKQTPGCPDTLTTTTPAELAFRARLKADRLGVIDELLSLKVSEWMNDGEDEIVRVLTNWVTDNVTWDDDYITEIAEGHLWNVDPEDEA